VRVVSTLSSAGVGAQLLVSADEGLRVRSAPTLL